MVHFKATPDAEDVGEQSRSDSRVLGALMFKEEVDGRISSGQAHLKEQVTFGSRQLGIYEGARLKAQNGPVQGAHHWRGEIVLKKLRAFSSTAKVSLNSLSCGWRIRSFGIWFRTESGRLDFSQAPRNLDESNSGAAFFKAGLPNAPRARPSPWNPSEEVSTRCNAFVQSGRLSGRSGRPAHLRSGSRDRRAQGS